MSNPSENILAKYVPSEALPLLMSLLRTERVEIKIKNPRSTKLGDYRFPGASGRHRISINANLNPYAFIITLVHEMAHLKAFKNAGREIKPHGPEWQAEFRMLAAPFLAGNIFPEDLAKALSRSLRKGHSSSCTDLQLYRSLKQYDKNPSIHVEDLSAGDVFELNGLHFRKGEKARKRYKCLCLSNGRPYMVHALAEVNFIKPESNHKSA